MFPNELQWAHVYLKISKRKYFERSEDWLDPGWAKLPEISMVLVLSKACPQNSVHSNSLDWFCTRHSWRDRSTVVGSNFFHKEFSLWPLWFLSHPDCLKISLATLNVTEIENNSGSSCNFFLCSGKSRLWRKKRPGAGPAANISTGSPVAMGEESQDSTRGQWGESSEQEWGPSESWVLLNATWKGDGLSLWETSRSLETGCFLQLYKQYRMVYVGGGMGSGNI